MARLLSEAPAITARPSLTLGRVRSLGDHLHPNWWHDLFNATYLKTDGDVVCDAHITRAETQMVCERLELAANDRILDVCCGHGRHTIELARRGFRSVTGIDQSAFLLSKAVKDADAENLSPRFLRGDARRLPFLSGSFDAVIQMGNSLGYSASIEGDEQILKQIAFVLTAGGRLLLDIADGEYLRTAFEPRSWEWIDDELFVCRERELSGDGERLISREVVCNANAGVIADQFYSERLYDRSEITRLLNAAGFQDFAYEGMKTSSDRDQDLGMMARRIMVSAVKRKGTTRRHALANGARARKVGVVLGDPAKPNSLIPQESFGSSDAALCQLKKALRNLPGYEFVYFSAHDRLFDELRRRAGELDMVLNLCDEGYQNRAHQELHVTAMLEMLGLAYTGSGPQCLAVCYDKSLVRAIAREYGIPTPLTYVVEAGETPRDLPFPYPAIAKPNFGDGSFGITEACVARNARELDAAVREIRTVFAYDKQILIEEFLPGAEVTVAILGNPPGEYRALPMMEEDYSKLPAHLARINGYEAKWLDVTPYEVVERSAARIPANQKRCIEEHSAKLAARLGCRDYTRFDWRLDAAGEAKLLEVNPNPAWSWIEGGDIEVQLRLAGMTYSQLLGEILQAAQRRLEPSPKRVAVHG